MGQKQGVRDVGLAFFLSLVYQTNQFTTTLSAQFSHGLEGSTAYAQRHSEVQQY